MCERAPGPRCAADTCTRAAALVAEYSNAHPDGPYVQPLAGAYVRQPTGEEALDAIFEHLGNAVRGRTEETYVLHRDLISTAAGLDGLADQLQYSKKPERYQRLLRAYRTGHDLHVERAGAVPDDVRQPPGWRDVEPLTDPEDVARASFDLYGYDRSPLRGKAREAMRRYLSRIDTFPPGEPHTVELDTAAIAVALKADLSNVPENVVAFDIETDTERGRGLQPHRAQITELVLTTREKTIVLSGDERHILQRFADFLNEQDKPMLAVGWNSRSFDLPFLAVRSRVHEIDGWAMELADSDVEAPYKPQGGFRMAQRMRWRTPKGVAHYDEDLMLTHCDQQGVRSARLKSSARESGMEPVEVDRERLHELDAVQREAYVSSDGISALHMFGETRRAWVAPDPARERAAPIGGSAA